MPAVLGLAIPAVALTLRQDGGRGGLAEPDRVRLPRPLRHRIEPAPQFRTKRRVL